MLGTNQIIINMELEEADVGIQLQIFELRIRIKVML